MTKDRTMLPAVSWQVIGSTYPVKSRWLRRGSAYWKNGQWHWFDCEYWPLEAARKPA